MACGVPTRARLIVLALAGAAVGAPAASAQKFVTYHCRDGTEFVAAFFPDTRTVALQLDGKAMTLASRLSASGARYGTGDVTLWIKGGNATLRRGGKSTECPAD